jgi:hypothetical protein
MNPSHEPTWYESLPPTLGEDVIMDWIDERISDERGKAMAHAAGRPEIIGHVMAMRANLNIMRDMATMDAPAECRTGLELAAEALAVAVAAVLVDF